MSSLSIIGLGKLGSCMAVSFAWAGFDVIGVDINKDFVDKINKGIAPVQEPLLQDFLTKYKKKIHATTDISEAMQKTDVSFLIVPTPSNKDDRFSTEYLERVLGEMSSYLKHKEYHLFVITSTIMPTDTEKKLMPIIKSKNVGFCYSPEFIALGSVITDFINPDFILIGESDKKAGDILEGIYKKVCLNASIKRMSIVSAEIAKISLNSFITMKISFANQLMNICQEIPNADIDDITNAMGCDRRISPHYLKGGLAYGGPCFPRDNRAFIKFANDYNSGATLAKETDWINYLQHVKLAEFILKHTTEKDFICILGVSYKPDTPVIEESPSLAVKDILSKNRKVTLIYDVDLSAFESAVKTCNTFVFMVNDERYWRITKYFKDRKVTVVDTWRRMINKKWPENVRYLPYGRYC